MGAFIAGNLFPSARPNPTLMPVRQRESVAGGQHASWVYQIELYDLGMGPRVLTCPAWKRFDPWLLEPQRRTYHDFEASKPG
jgi:hypothetical protein